MPRRVGSGAVERHTDGISLFVEREVIHELFNQKESASRRTIDAIGPRGVGNAIRIETLALVLHVHLNPTIELAKRNVNSLPRIEPVTVHDGIGQGLRKRDAEIEANRLDGQTASQAVPRYDVDGMLDDIQFTRNRDGHQDGCIGAEWMRWIRAPHA